MGETSYTSPEHALDAVYRAQAADTFFEGYEPPARFEHAKRTLVGRYPSNHQKGLSCRIFETRYPASFYEADIEDQVNNLVATVSTSSGRRMGVLLSDLCEALSNAEASLDSSKAPQPAGGHWRKLKALYATPGDEGQDVDLYQHTSEEGWMLVAARPNGSGAKRRSGCSLYVQDDVLAERLCEAINQGMLSIQELDPIPV